MNGSLKTRSAFDRELQRLRDDVVRLSYLAERAIKCGVQSLKEQDVKLAREIIADDHKLNALRFEVENNCYRILALQQPTARDLRSVVTAIHIVVELERIGDHAAGIAHASIELAQEPHLKPLIDVPRMAGIAIEMLHDSLDAYLNWDAPKAQLTAERDTEVDELDRQVNHELVTFMLQDPRNIKRAMNLQWVSHSLERIADRVTNICERVVFMVTGEIGEFTNNENDRA